MVELDQREKRRDVGKVTSNIPRSLQDSLTYYLGMGKFVPEDYRADDFDDKDLGVAPTESFSLYAANAKAYFDGDTGSKYCCVDEEVDYSFIVSWASEASAKSVGVLTGSRDGVVIL